MELYGTRGYEETTVAEIATRAGVTERTFFRYFADKREVLFYGSERLLDEMLSGLDAAPRNAAALELVRAAICRMCDNFVERDYSRRRQKIIAANPVLQERELIKLASFASRLDEALQMRGIPEPVARLAAEMGLAAFRVGWERWLDATDARSMHDVFCESFDQLKAVAAGVS